MDVVLDSVETLSESTLAFRFVPALGELVRFKPGQFYRFTFTDTRGSFERSYSLCNLGDAVCEGEIETSVLDLVISRVEKGRATDLLFSAAPGLTASVTGPFGRLVLPQSLPARIVLVATSVGIAPYLPILKQLETPLAQNKVELVFLYGTRDTAEFLYADYFVDYQKAYSENVDLRVCLSRETKPSTSPFANYFYSGYVQSQLNQLALDASQDLVMLCGNPAMVDESYAYLKGEGFRRSGRDKRKVCFCERSCG